MVVNPDSKKSDEIIVFQCIRESKCNECGREIRLGDLLRIEVENHLCLSCSDLDHLVFLPSGNTALTRRARKHSTLHAIVKRFSSARKRNERQGILIEEAALEQAEGECLADEDARELARERAAERRARLDTEYVRKFAELIRERYPSCPPSEEQIIAERACEKYSGRVGRSESAKQFDPGMIDLAVWAHVRHQHTKYDLLLEQGWPREDARKAVVEMVEDLLAKWS